MMSTRGIHVVDRVVFYNEGEYDNDTNLFTVAYSKDFRVLVSDSDLDEDSFNLIVFTSGNNLCNPDHRRCL